MITNITEKCIAYLQIVIFQRTNHFAQKCNRLARIITPIVCVIDVTAETGKHPAIVIENIAVGVINSCGSAFSEACSTQDAYKNIQKIETSSLTAITMTLLLPWNLLGNLRVNLPDPKHAHSCNRQAEEQVKEPMIVYNSINLRLLQKVINKEPMIAYNLRNLRPLQEGISIGIVSVIENIPIRPILINSSVDETALEAIDMIVNSIINRGSIIYKTSDKNITHNPEARISLNNSTDPVCKEVINQNKAKKSIA